MRKTEKYRNADAAQQREMDRKEFRDVGLWDWVDGKRKVLAWLETSVGEEQLGHATKPVSVSLLVKFLGHFFLPIIWRCRCRAAKSARATA